MAEFREADILVSLHVGAVFDGVVPDERSMLAALAQLSRDDALLICAKINTIVSGFSAKYSHPERQANALGFLQLPQETARIDAYVARNPAQSRPIIFFRGQLLELARWIAANCQNHPDEPHTFNAPEARSAFLRAALIASELWSQRIYAQRLREIDDPKLQLRRALGAFRKGTEEGNEAMHPGLAIGRGWLLFSRYFRARNPDFDLNFEARTGLSLEKYYVCATFLMSHTFADDMAHFIFQTVGYRGTSRISQACDAFIKIKSQAGADLARALSKPSDVTGYRSLRDRPILNFSGNRSAILDPTLFSDTLTIAPLFVLLRGADKRKANEIFSQFGMAFEDYAIGLLQSMYPEGTGVLAKRLDTRVERYKHRLVDFEIDAIVNDVTSAVVFEMKASWVREDKILSDDPQTFTDHLQELYGMSASSEERPKGVAQLAKIVAALARDGWAGNQGEYSQVKSIYPVLLVHDERMGAAGIGNFLDQEFRRLLGPVSMGMFVHSLIIMTITDLENLQSSVQDFSLTQFLCAYSVHDPQRMRSVRNFMATSEYADKVRPSEVVKEASFELGRIARTCFGPDGSAAPP